MTSSQNRIVQPDLSITVDFPKCEKTLCFLCKSKKASYGNCYGNHLSQGQIISLMSKPQSCYSARMWTDFRVRVSGQE